MELVLLQKVGELGGPVAIAAVVYLYLKVKAIDKRLDDGDKRMSTLTTAISTMSENIAFIRGLLEGKEEK